MHTHTHHVHAPHVHLCICVCSTSFSLEPAIPPFPSCNLISLFGDMVETVASFFFGEVASRDRLRDQTAEGMCSLLCVRSRGNSGDQKIAFGSPAFCNYSRGLVLIALLCLLALLYSLCLLQRSLCKWGLCRLDNKHKYLRRIIDVKKLWVFQLHLANVIEYSLIVVWLLQIVMMYLSLLVYNSLYYKVS